MEVGRGNELVERDAELRRLTELVASLRERGRLVLVSGDAGTGKSSLVAAVRDGPAAGILFRSGRCEPISTPAPFGPLYEMLPKLPPEIASALSEGAPRELLFSHVLGELQRTPSVLAIDDIHWADEATLDLLRYVGRRAPETKALIIATFRGGEIDRAHPARLLLGELAPSAERFELGALTVEGVKRLVDNAPVDPIEIYAASGGNPFFVAQMLADPSAELPQTVADAVLARAQRLSPTAWEVLDLIALSPEGVPLSLLDRAAPTAETDLDAAVRAGLVVVEDDRVRAAHELTRLALESAVPPARRRRIHRGLAGSLSASATTAADVATLAHHAVESGDPDLIVTHAIPAARRAASDGAHLEAVAHYRHALAHEDRIDPEELVAVLEGYYYECYLTGALAEAREAVSRTVDLSRTANERGRHLRWLSRISWLAADRAGAERYGREACEVLASAGADPHELGFAYSNMAQLAMLAGDVAETRQWAEAAQEIAEAEGDVEVLAHALNNLGAVSGPEGREYLERSLALALEHDLEEHAARAFTNLSHVALLSRDLTLATELFRRGLEYTETRDLETWWIAMLDGRSMLHLRAGDWEAAERDAEHTIQAGEGTILVEWAHVVTASLAMRRGDPGSEEATAAVIERSRSTGEMDDVVTAAAIELERAWHVGDPPDPVVLEDGLRAAETARDPWRSASLAFWLLRTGRRLPDVSPAPPIAAELNSDQLDGAEVWSELGCLYEAAVLRGLHGDAEHRRVAVGDLLELGAAATVRAVRRDLARRGVRELPRGPNRATRRHPVGLTERQEEVLRLLVEGRSNADIAATLYISPKTVEHHVSAILTKLGAGSRTQAAAIAHDEGLV